MVFSRYANGVVYLCLFSLPLFAAPKLLTGEQIYKADCARCHGVKGEGVADKHDEPLYGDRSVDALARLIAKTMPEDKEQKCPPEEAAKVAAYIYDEFYSPAARLRNQPPRVQLSRLTIRQYENAIADLILGFRKPVELNDKHGLSGEYFSARNFNNDRKAVERIDSRVEFNFADGSPASETNKQEFSIRWTGSLLAEETGDYEFCLKTENGARLFINTSPRRRRGDGPEATIDGWVSSGSTVREERGTVRLLGGRAYPIQVDFFKFKDKTASIVLEWKPPHKSWQTIPERNLVPVRVPETMVITTAFPPDDGSVGYERGTAVSKAWDQATTHAAIEVATKVLAQLSALSGCRSDQPDYGDCLQQFCRQFAERAFRRPLSDAEARAYIQKHFDNAPDAEAALKRVILLVLKSPRFLYPEIPGANPDDYDIASRLSFALWDTLPDTNLLAAAREGKLREPAQIAAHAERMLKDARAKAKVRDFFSHWLEMDGAEDVSKDAKVFPDFSDTVLSDLRTSLEMFIDDVVWSPKSDYRQLLLADYVFLNDRLAKLYGAQLPDGADFQKVSFNSKQRTGVITHPYLLSVFAYHKSSSPIHRGVFLTRNIVGRSLKPPPMAIQFMDGSFDPSLTMREKVAELTRPAACQGCHSVINPLGFSLEHYDAVGRYRITDNQKPVDAASKYTTSDGKTVRLTGAHDVAEYAAKSKEAQLGFVQQLFHHMVKQPAAAYGPDTLERLRRAFAKSDYNIQQLVIEIVKTSALHNENS